MPTSSRARRGQPRKPPAEAAADESLVQDPAEVRRIAERLANRSIVAFDTEFLREKTFFPQLGLLQVADRHKTWLVDPLALGKKDLEPLLDVLRSPEVLKVAHAAAQDQECLYLAYGIVAAPLLDTAVAAALCGYGDQVGLGALLQKLLGVRLAKGYSRTNWLKRPLSKAVADYARADVSHLVEAAEKLLRELDALERRQWAIERSAEWSDPARFEPDPESIVQKLARNSRMKPVELGVLTALVHWREKRIRELDIPRRWLADDKVLLRLARVRPKDAAGLAEFEDLPCRKKPDLAGQILEAIRRGESQPVRPEARPEKIEPTEEETPAVTVLKCLVSLLAKEKSIPARMLAQQEALVLLLRENFQSVEELRRSGVLDPQAVDLLGEELVSFLQGRLAIRIEKGRVRFDRR